MRIRNRAVAPAILRRPLMRPGRALGQFPFVFEQVLEEVVAPLRWGCGPNDFQSAADGVSATTFTEFILPAEALVLYVGTFWFGSNVVRGDGSAVGFSECMATGNQRNRFFVVHRHAAESFE